MKHVLLTKEGKSKFSEGEIYLRRATGIFTRKVRIINDGKSETLKVESLEEIIEQAQPCNGDDIQRMNSTVSEEEEEEDQKET